MSIIDTSANTTSELACLKSKDVTAVIRYYNFSNSQQSGMQIAVVFQQGQNRASAFSDAQGFKAGIAAFATRGTRSASQPAPGSISPSISTRALMRSDVPYFQGVRQAFGQESGGGPSYLVGVYGSGLG